MRAVVCGLALSEKPRLRFYWLRENWRISDATFLICRRCSSRLHLSPLLFNLYINDLPYSFDNILSDPFVLPNGAKFSSLLYADYLIIAITWIKGKNAKLSQCFGPVLQIVYYKHNIQKKPVRIFQRRAEKDDCTFYVGNATFFN